MHRCTISLVSTVIAISFILSPASADTTEWQHCACSPATWFDPANWTAGLPASDDHANIGNGGTALIGGSTAAADYLWLGRDGGDGTVIHSGGTMSVSTELALGTSPDSRGTYEISGDAQLSIGNRLWVSSQSYGLFKQTGGRVFVGNSLGIGGNRQSAEQRVSVYELHDGSLLVGDTIYMNGASDGVFDQRGGTVESMWFELNNNARYMLSGGQLTPAWTVLNTGTNALAGSQIIQTGGDHVIRSIGCTSGSFVMGNFLDDPDLVTLYEIADGTFSANLARIGTVGLYNVFRQSGGTVTIAGTVYLGEGETGPVGGTWELSGGQFVNNMLNVGYRGQGQVIQSGGAHIVQQGLVIGFGGEATGLYEISAGSVETPAMIVGLQGTGTLRITDPTVDVTVSQQLRFGPHGSLEAVPGATIHMTGAGFGNQCNDPSAMAGLANLTLIFEGGQSAIDRVEVAGIDCGPDPSGCVANFLLDTLQLGGDAGIGQVKLVDDENNQTGWAGTEALYVNHLILGPGSCLDLNGLNLYYGTLTDLGATIILNGGSVMQIPEPAAVSLLLVGLALATVRRRRV